VSTPAWVSSPPIFRTPFLRAILPDYELRALPGPDVKAVVGWGLRSTSAVGRSWAAVFGKPYVALEDGFFRSVGLGEAGAASLSLIADDLGVYYDATRPSRLEELIAGAPEWLTEKDRDRARSLVDRIVAARLSKTNIGRPLDHGLLRSGRRILIVDQTAGDASIRFGGADEATFLIMLQTARREAAEAQLIVKRHPAAAAGLKRGCLPASALTGLTVVDDVLAADLLDAVDEVWTVTSGLGFEALLRRLPVRCFGQPFYAGWGLTRDEQPHHRRGHPRDLESLAAAVLFRYTRWVDPVPGEPCTAEQAVDRLAFLRDRAERLSGRWIGVGFTPPKRAAVRRLMNGPGTQLTFHDDPAAPMAADPGDGLLVWAGRETGAVAEVAARFSGPVVRMEDGFLRSRGLGSGFVGALSVAIDDEGVYYDPERPSRLESLIQAGEVPPELLARALRLRERIVASGLSKYNLSGLTPPPWPADRERILVPGQVEDDRSILLGCAPDLRTNAALVRAVRAEHPDAYLIYRDHPDVRSGVRVGALPAEAERLVDARADDLDISACIEATDAVATLTSLTGFEALLRGKRVIAYGRPFYAGWGLTQDRLPIPRRTRRAGLDELVAAALILYPLYVTPEGWPCEAEDLVDRLSEAPPPRPLPRPLRAALASMDRRRPPAY